MNQDERTRLEDDILAALATHQRWRAFIRESRDLPIDVAVTVGTIAQCPISAWLDERMPQACRGLDLYEKTQAAHHDFHRAVDAVVAGRSDGTFPRAATLLKSYLEQWLTFVRSA